MAKNPKIELLNIDCVQYMSAIDDNFFDVAIVDPPYGHGNRLIRKGNTRSKIVSCGKHSPYDNSSPPEAQYFNELKRVSKNQIIWGANHFADRFNAAGSKWIVWDKQTTGDFADCELAYTSFPGALRCFRYMWNGMHQGSIGGNTKLNEKRIHPTQKPVKLYQWLLNQFLVPGQRVLDTHFGSASSAIACYYFGCDYVGCEIDREYYMSALQRYQDLTRQQEMGLYVR